MVVVLVSVRACLQGGRQEQLTRRSFCGIVHCRRAWWRSGPMLGASPSIYITCWAITFPLSLAFMLQCWASLSPGSRKLYGERSCARSFTILSIPELCCGARWWARGEGEGERRGSRAAEAHFCVPIWKLRHNTKLCTTAKESTRSGFVVN